MATFIVVTALAILTTITLQTTVTQALSCTTCPTLTSFSSDPSVLMTDHGLKIAGNDVFAVSVYNSAPSYLQVYNNYTDELSWCNYNLPQDNNSDATPAYAYTVAVGSNDVEMTVAVLLRYSDPSSSLEKMSLKTVINMDPSAFSTYAYVICSPSTTPIERDLQAVSEEFVTLGLSPDSGTAIVVGTQLSAIYQLQTDTLTILSTWTAADTNNTNLWSDDTFGPRGIAVAGNYTVVGGLTIVPYGRKTDARPCIYLLEYTATTLVVRNRWVWTPTAGSWQSQQHISDAQSWNYNEVVSLSLRADGTLLAGFPVVNTLFVFKINTNNMTLTLTGSKSNGKSIGFAQTVSWTNEGYAMVLANSLTLDGTGVLASSIAQAYQIDGVNFNDVASPQPLYAYPNTQQPLSEYIYGNLVAALASPSNLILQDGWYDTILLSTSPLGTYVNNPLAAQSVYTSCPAGTYKDNYSFMSCNLCPEGTYYNGQGNVSISCTNCSDISFCPLASTGESPLDSINIITQGFIYPSSPESTLFDEIIISNTFQIGSGDNCLQRSPLFWALMVGVLSVILALIVVGIRYCYTNPEDRQKATRFAKWVFRRTDLVQEGEHWLGGLASLSIVVMAIMAFVFASNFIQQYPIETAPNPSGYTCGTLYNAKFSTGLQLLSLPVEDEVQTMMNMLDEQPFILQIEIINTNIQCLSITSFLIQTNGYTTIDNQCNIGNDNNSVILLINLPTHGSEIELYIDPFALAGAIRIGLLGAGDDDIEDSTEYTLRNLEFHQPFYQYNNVLQSNIAIDLEITKVINVTDALESTDLTEISGLWTPTFTNDINNLFMNSFTALQSSATTSYITISISETNFWISNNQSPITRSSEVAFKMILFVIMLLEVFGLFFLLFKLTQPGCRYIYLSASGQRTEPVWNKRGEDEEEEEYASLGGEGGGHHQHSHAEHSKSHQSVAKVAPAPIMAPIPLLAQRPSHVGEIAMSDMDTKRNNTIIKETLPQLSDLPNNANYQPLIQH